jgi:hypothetical protein
MEMGCVFFEVRIEFLNIIIASAFYIREVAAVIAEVITVSSVRK